MKTNVLIISLFVLLLHMKTSGQQILVHNFEPDTLFTNYADTLKLDINFDGDNDIAFYLSATSSGGYVRVKSINPFCQYAFFWKEYETDSISSSLLNWHTNSVDWLIGLFTEYLGIKFTLGEDVYYGWLKGKPYWSDKGAQFLSIDRYAFCTVPNYPLLCGQTEIKTGNAEHPVDKTKTWLENGRIHVQSGKPISKVAIIDVAGQSLHAWDAGEDYNFSAEINGRLKGVFLAKVTLKNKVVRTFKLVLE